MTDHFHTLMEVARTLNQGSITYVIGGSSATALNGCTSITPNDIDIIVQNPEDVKTVILMFEDTLADSMASESKDMKDWISTKSVPVTEFEDPFTNAWSFARVVINNVKVEIANIRPTTPYIYMPQTGLWENGPMIWPHVKHVAIEGMTVPVVPLEIQLQTNIERKLEGRARDIINLFKRDGFDSELLKFSLSKENYRAVMRMIPGLLEPEQ